MAIVDLVLLWAAGATCVGILIFGFAGGLFCRSMPPPTRSDVRRHMVCGLYCNPEDPRTIVHRPNGIGWTINVRREECAQLLIVMAALAVVALLIYLVLRGNPPSDMVKFVPA